MIVDRAGRCERWIGSVRRECTDRMLAAGQRHLYTVGCRYGLSKLAAAFCHPHPGP